jgi:hypothetical protein
MSPVGVPPNSDQPDASHRVAEKQETPRRTAFVAPGASGVVSRAQVVPFQAAARGSVAAVWPTAWHTVVETQDTPYAAAPPPEPQGRFGLDVHVEPFQSEAIARPPEGDSYVPTARHHVAETQLTPLRAYSDPPAGTATAGVVVQLNPFQTWASALPALAPTATHEVVDVQETPSNVALLAVGVGRCVHVELPLKPAVNGLLSVGAVFQPTPMHQLDDTHDTALSEDFVAPAGTPTLW